MKQFGLALIAFFFIVACGNSGGPSPASPGAAVPGKRPGMATGEVGNGEHGVFVNGKVYSLDLVEAGIEEKPYFRFAFLEARLSAWNSNYLSRVRKKFQGQAFPIDKLALKLHDLSSVDPLLALAVLQTIEMYHWHIIPKDLSLLPLAGGIVNYREGEVVLIANRRGRSIYLAGPFWNLMDPANQVAAMIHEAIYALIKPRPDPQSRDPRVFFTQDSVRVRELTHLLFEKDLFDPAFIINPGELPFLDRSQLPAGTYPGTFDSVANVHHWGMVSPPIDLAKAKPPSVDSRKIITPAMRITLIGESKPSGGGKPVQVILSGSDPFLTHHKDPLTVGMGLRSGTLPDIEKLCEEVQGKDYRFFVRWESIAQDRAGDNLNTQLKFSTYQSEKEEKTYVKFEAAPALSSDEQDVVLSTTGRKECVDRAKAVAWQYALSLYYDYSTYVPAGEPIFDAMYSSRTPHSLRNGNYRPDWIYQH
jgi:hypothetical protein